MADTKLTTVKLITDVYNVFRVSAFHDGFTLQRLVNRTLYLYNNDAEFKERIQGMTCLAAASGSSY